MSALASESSVMSDPDVVVVGGGAVGENVADYAVRGGLSAMIVEAELLGGECSYWACMPSKALLRTGHAVAALRRLPGTTATFDPAAVLARRDAITHDWDDAGQVEWAEGAGIALLRGPARLTGTRTVDGGRRRRSPPGMRSCSAPGASRSGRRCPGWTRCAPGPPGTPPRPSGSRRGSACSAAGWSAASWPRRSDGSARR